jgi:hypothetical protein
MPMIDPMPNLYFCQPHAQNQGMLRAVLTLDDCRHLVDPHPATYVGDRFPNISNESAPAADFAVLSVSATEADAEWRSGFYRLDTDLMELNAVLQKLVR